MCRCLEKKSITLNSEVDIEEYNFIGMEHPKKGGGVACYIRQSLFYNH